MRKQDDWTKGAAELAGPRFTEFQVGLTKYNAVTIRASALPEDIHPLTN